MASYIIERDHASIVSSLNESFPELLSYYSTQSKESGSVIEIPSAIEENGVFYPVTEILEGAFSNCPQVETIILPKTIQKIQWNMLRCNNLNRIEVDNANPYFSSVDGVLYSKDKRRLIACPAARTGRYVINPKTTQISSFAFKGCAYLTDVVIPQVIHKIGNNVFYRCTSLKTVVIPSGIDPGNIGFYFDNEASKHSEPQIIYRGKTFKSINDIKNLI